MRPSAIVIRPIISLSRLSDIFAGSSACRVHGQAGKTARRKRDMDSSLQLVQLKEKFGPAIQRADLPDDNCLFVFVEPSAVKDICRYIFRDLDARYVISIGADDRPFSGSFLVAHDFAFDQDHLLCSILTHLPADNPRVDSISCEIPAANWAEREISDMVGIETVGHPYPKRLVLPD